MYVDAAQVQCVREVLLQMASMYTNLIMRADLPASKRGVKVSAVRTPEHAVATQ